MCYLPFLYNYFFNLHCKNVEVEVCLQENTISVFKYYFSLSTSKYQFLCEIYLQYLSENCFCTQLFTVIFTYE